MQYCSNDTLDAIQEAVEESVENMAFMIIDTDLDGMRDCEGDAVITAVLEVLTPRCGWMRLSMPRGTAVEIARTLYRVMGAELSDAVLDDVVCELLNTIAGRVMKRLLPAECAFSLGFPEIWRQGDGRENQGGASCDFLADGRLLTVAAEL